MARLARQKRQVEDDDALSDELPEVSTLLKGNTRVTKIDTDRTERMKATTSSPARRISPRRQGPAITRITNTGGGLGAVSGGDLNLNKPISAIGLSTSTFALPSPTSPVKRSPVKRSPTKTNATTRLSPVKRNTVVAEDESGAATSMQQRQRSLKLAHVNSLLLPLSRVVLGHQKVGEQLNGEYGSSLADSGRVEHDTEMRSKGSLAGGSLAPTFSFHAQNVENDRAQNARRSSPKRAAKEQAKYLSRFVLKEAHCHDGSDDSDVDEDEDDDSTDLSGFVVDDDADLSVGSSDSEGNIEFDRGAETSKRREQTRRRRLQPRRDETRAGKGDVDENDIAGKGDINIGNISQDPVTLSLSPSTSEEISKKEIKVIDLTYSPPKPQPTHESKPAASNINGMRPNPIRRLSSDKGPFFAGKNDHLLRFSPPRLKSPAKIPITASLSTTTTGKLASTFIDSKEATTPPITPPTSPAKLKSPSKLLLLSPSKRGAAIPMSPHRQSIDAFWSSDVINSWNDQYSPHKPPLTVNPKKHGLARVLDFDIWSDADSENDNAHVSKNDSVSSSDPPTPTRRSSPGKAPKPPSMQSNPSKKALVESQKAFLATRHTTAQSLLTHLDTHITSGKLSALSASTGGVQISWSKNLRSTAGRANWRRTVTKAASGSTKTDSNEQQSVQHYASIELAEKVIDSDSRLVNTLAHEFCHLANFMVSGVRDQPHGASFRIWAHKVTSHLRTAPNIPELYRAVEVTTKHSYVINHKYLWICTGTAPVGSAQAAARAFLTLDDDPGCGAEYGRHSKSIDPERHRCGKCKGLLVQVKPKPKPRTRKVELDEKGESPKKGRRTSPAKRRIPSNDRADKRHEGGGSVSNDELDGLERALEYVILGD